jgi:hypothetical protein
VGQRLTHLISFATGFPDAAVSWQVHDTAGNLVTSGSFTPASGAVSAIITVPGSANTLGSGVVYGTRDLSWSYTAGSLAQAGELRYSIEARLPFGIQRDGVRTKLGVEAHELPDDQIGMVRAYLAFQERVSSDLLDTFADASAYEQLVIADGIEAAAALALIPTMQVRLASKEANGTNQYQRADIDWAAVQGFLQGLIDDAVGLVNPALGADVSIGNILLLTTPDDPFTG